MNCTHPCHQSAVQQLGRACTTPARLTTAFTPRCTRATLNQKHHLVTASNHSKAWTGDFWVDHMWQRKCWLERKKMENVSSHFIFSLWKKKTNVTEIVKTSTTLAQHRKRKEREDSLRRETVTVFCCGCHFTNHCLLEAAGVRMRQRGSFTLQRKPPECPVSPWASQAGTWTQTMTRLHWLQSIPWELSLLHPWEWQRNRSQQPEFRLQGCSIGLPGLNKNQKKTSQFYAGLREFLQLANSSRDFEDFSSLHPFSGVEEIYSHNRLERDFFYKRRRVFSKHHFPGSYLCLGHPDSCASVTRPLTSSKKSCFPHPSIFSDL